MSRAERQKLLRRIRAESNALPNMRLRPDPVLKEAVEAVPIALAAGDPLAVKIAAQTICDRICDGFGVERVLVLIAGPRPIQSRAEVHGHYFVLSQMTPRIRIWMLTSRRLVPVGPRIFLRTLVHELCHHLDVQLFGLVASPHTEGFRRRVASLLCQVAGPVRRSPRRAARTPASSAAP